MTQKKKEVCFSDIVRKLFQYQLDIDNEISYLEKFKDNILNLNDYDFYLYCSALSSQKRSCLIEKKIIKKFNYKKHSNLDLGDATENDVNVEIKGSLLSNDKKTKLNVV